MEIQQHDGVVVDAAAISAGLRQASTRGRGVARGEGGAKSMGAAALPPPSLYRPPQGGAGPRRWDLQGGAAAKGVACPPRQVEAPPALGFPTLGAGGPRGGAPAHQGLVTLPLHPMGPSG